MCSIPLDTLQIGMNQKLEEWVVLDGMSSITLHFISFHSIPFLQNQTMEFGYISLHFIPFHHSPSIQT